MDRLKKLKKVVVKSSLANKGILITHFNKTIGRASTKKKTDLMDTVLAFGKSRPTLTSSKKKESDFRLYARLTLAIKGCFLTKTANVTQLKKTFAETRYCDLTYAKAEYEKARMLLWLEKNDTPLEVNNADQLALLFPNDYERYLDSTHNAAVLAKAVVNNAVVKLESGGDDVNQALALWFGAVDKKNEVLANFKKIQTRLNSSNKINLTVVNESDAYGYVNGTANTVFLTKRFFDPTQVNPTSTFAKNYVLNEKNKQWLRDASVLKDKISKIKLAGITMDLSDDNESLFDFLLKKHPYSPDQNKKERNITSKIRPLGVLGLKKDTTITQAKAILQTLIVSKDKLFEDNPSTANKMTGYGVLIHELSHLVVGTDDVFNDEANLKTGGQCYGALLCSYLAEKKPSSALKNADNYRLYAQSFGPQF